MSVSPSRAPTLRSSSLAREATGETSPRDGTVNGPGDASSDSNYAFIQAAQLLPDEISSSQIRLDVKNELIF